MSIQASELVWRKSSVVVTGATNGNVMGTAVSASGAKNNVFPDVPSSERTAGSTVYRKMFILVNNSESDGNGNLGLALIAPKLFVETRTPGDDAVNLFLGTQSDTEADLTGSEDLYGMGVLTNPVSGGASSITVTVEDWSGLPIFRNGDTIRISDKTDINDAGNNEEYHVINGVPSPSGNQITLTLTGTLANGYSAGAKVSSVIEPADVECSVDGFSNNGTGTFSAAGITTDNTGTIEMDWTLTFDTSTAYTVRDSSAQSVGSGNVGSDFTPNNPNGGTYFTLLSASFGGTFTGNDTIDFSTHPAAIPVWYRRDVPAGASSLSGNSVIVAVDGESS